MFTFGIHFSSMEQFFHREIRKSADGSHTLYLPHWQEHYHSVHGALSESLHVFIREGLDRWLGNRNASGHGEGDEGVDPAVGSGLARPADHKGSPGLDGRPARELAKGLGGLSDQEDSPASSVLPDKEGSPCPGSLRILEVGFGTGLNALLTLARSMEYPLCVDYLALEPYPLREEEYLLLNIPEMVSGGAYADAYLQMHRAPLAGHQRTIQGRFSFRLLPVRLEEAELPSDHFDLVYHDAFAPQFQPSLWDEEAFARLFRAMKEGALLTTYSARGSVKRAMRSAGFRLEHPQGPPGKREMSRAIKPLRPNP